MAGGRVARKRRQTRVDSSIRNQQQDVIIQPLITNSTGRVTRSQTVANQNSETSNSIESNNADQVDPASMSSINNHTNPVSRDNSRGSRATSLLDHEPLQHLLLHNLNNDFPTHTSALSCTSNAINEPGLNTSALQQVSPLL
ncbi:hypothetical protein INT45_008917 [Circinella minor]|uniref:Uncharacterized protein n=1 Tax=Circinella minor TaxID=1195481 RepID=A0A8H7VEQ9_9FUNG|nr:hypothetical protein INT45_008917 [Circinella minor]